MPGLNELVADGGNCITGSLAVKGAASLTFIWPNGGGGTEDIKLMSGKGGSGGGWAVTFCGGADIIGSGAMAPAKLDAGITLLTGPTVLGCKILLGRLDGGRLLGGNGKCLGEMLGGSTDGGGKLTSTFGINLPCAGPRT